MWYPAPERVAETEGDDGGVEVMSFPVWAGGEERTFTLPTMTSSESTTHENTVTALICVCVGVHCYLIPLICVIKRQSYLM